MEHTQKKIAEYLILGLLYGCIYVSLEMLWRGRSHWTMMLLGAVCGICIGLLNEIIPWDMGFVWQCLIGAGIVTALEFITGLIVNVWLGWNVWDYSNMPFNVMGQICLPFSLLWVLLSGVCIVVDDYLRYWLFDEEKPHYKPF